MSNRVREVRQRRGMRREELSVASGVPWRTIEQIESGRSGMRVATAAKLAAALDCTIDDLVAEDGDL